MNKYKKDLKERLKAGDVVFGTWSNIPSASLVNVICLSGIDFIVIDGEHGPVSVETAENLVRAAEVCGVSPIIRIPANRHELVLRALDIGAYGVQVPHVSTKEDAMEVVRSSKYYPLGERGYSPFTRAGKYGSGAAGHAKRSNENTLIALNIEGSEGLKNLERIVNVDGIDVIFIGPYDLSQSLGKPGEVYDPEVIASIRKSANFVRSKGLSCGSFACDLKYLDILIDCGVQYITYMVDSALLLQTYGDIYRKFSEKKKGIKP